jgi:hypothetical protein
VVAVFLIPAWIPALRTEPWEWIVVAIQAIFTVAMVVYLVRLGSGTNARKSSAKPPPEGWSPTPNSPRERRGDPQPATKLRPVEWWSFLDTVQVS